MQIVKKITMRDLGTEEQIKQVVEGNKTVELAHVYGTASSVKSGESAYGPWYGLVGEFTAVNASTGEEYHSAVAILPEIAQELVIAALKDSTAGVDIAFTILAIPHRPEGKVKGLGFKYGAKPLMQPKISESMQRLRSLLPGSAPAQIAAPATAQIAAPAPKSVSAPVPARKK